MSAKSPRSQPQQAGIERTPSCVGTREDRGCAGL